MDGSADLKPDMLSKCTSAEDVVPLKAFYEQTRGLPSRLPYVHDFSGIFSDQDGVYTQDGIHATEKGDKVVAEKVLSLILAEIYRISGGTHPQINIPRPGL